MLFDDSLIAVSDGLLACAQMCHTGWLLQDCSEIMANLEDNALNLQVCILPNIDNTNHEITYTCPPTQAMSNSPYAVAFSKDIRTWEQSLNHVMECITTWMLVQRKWMYLEGIFIGSEDIRAQLPEAAKKVFLEVLFENCSSNSSLMYIITCVSSLIEWISNSRRQCTVQRRRLMCSRLVKQSLDWRSCVL